MVRRRTKNRWEMVRIELSEQDVAVRNCQWSTAPIASGTRVSPRTLRSNLIAAIPKLQDRTTTRSDGMNIHHRRTHPNTSDFGFERTLVFTCIVRHISRRTAHIEADYFVNARQGRSFDHPHDTTRGTGQDRVLSLKQACIRQAAI